MMTMYSRNYILQMMQNKDLYTKETQKYCLIKLSSEVNKKDAINQINFSILRVVHDYNAGFLSKEDVYTIIDKVETYEYIIDLLGAKQVINKINKEILNDILSLENFDFLCIPCPGVLEDVTYK